MAETRADGWMGEARFAQGGTEAKDANNVLSVRTINPRRGSAFSVVERMGLLRRALRTRPPTRGTNVYLTSAGFFGFRALAGKIGADSVAPNELSRAELRRIGRGLTAIACSLPAATYLAVGVDHGESQELWWYESRRGTRFRVAKRADAPTPVRLDGDFVVLPYVCGSIYDSAEGHPLDIDRDLDGVDVVLDAGHASLNRIAARVLPATARRWAFQRVIGRIASRCGAMFSHAHGGDFATKVRDRDNWVVYRGGRPYPGPRAGFAIGA